MSKRHFAAYLLKLTFETTGHLLLCLAAAEWLTTNPARPVMTWAIDRYGQTAVTDAATALFAVLAFALVTAIASTDENWRRSATREKGGRHRRR